MVCDNFMANGSILYRALASVTTFLKARWAFVDVMVYFLSFGLVLAIVVVVGVGKLNIEIRERRLLMLSLL